MNAVKSDDGLVRSVDLKVARSKAILRRPIHKIVLLISEEWMFPSVGSVMDFLFFCLEQNNTLEHWNWRNQWSATDVTSLLLISCFVQSGSVMKTIWRRVDNGFVGLEQSLVK